MHYSPNIIYIYKKDIYYSYLVIFQNSFKWKIKILKAAEEIFFTYRKKKKKRKTGEYCEERLLP